MSVAQDFTQNVLRPGVIELAYGEPDPGLLPVDLVRSATLAALDEYGPGALAYGQLQGPPALRDAVARRLSALEGRTVAADDLLVSGGNSQALDQVLTALTKPGDVVLVEVPTYNLALGIIADHPVEVTGVPLDDEGLDVEALEATLDVLTSSGRRARLLYTVATYHNPAGVSLSAARRLRLLELARRRDLVVVEDDVYRELPYEDEAPPALRALDAGAPVVRLGSFSKSLAPGLRVGYIDARADLRERLAAAGVLESGGCPSQFAATAVARVLLAGVYDAHVARLRRAYAARRDALVDALRLHLPAGCRFAVPAGGFFVWLRLPPGILATPLLGAAEPLGVAFAPGARFRTDGDDSEVRLAFSLYDERELAEGARRLGDAIAAALTSAGISGRS